MSVSQVSARQDPPRPPLPGPPPPPLLAPPLPPPLPPSLATTKTHKYVPILKTILEGLYDKESNLNKLRGCQNVMKIIWTNVMEYSKPAIRSLDKGMFGKGIC